MLQPSRWGKTPLVELLSYTSRFNSEPKLDSNPFVSCPVRLKCYPLNIWPFAPLWCQRLAWPPVKWVRENLNIKWGKTYSYEYTVNRNKGNSHALTVHQANSRRLKPLKRHPGALHSHYNTVLTRSINIIISNVIDRIHSDKQGKKKPL